MTRPSARTVPSRGIATACSRTLKGSVPISALRFGINLFRLSALGGAFNAADAWSAMWLEVRSLCKELMRS